MNMPDESYRKCRWVQVSPLGWLLSVSLVQHPFLACGTPACPHDSINDPGVTKAKVCTAMGTGIGVAAEKAGGTLVIERK